MKFKEMPYVRVGAEEAKKRYQELIDRARQAASGEELYQVHREYYRLADDIETSMMLAYTRRDIDTSDVFYEKEQEYYDEIGPVLEEYANAYQKVLYDSPYRPWMEEKIGSVSFKNMELAMKSFDEGLIPLLQEENALVSRYEKLMASAQIPFEGEICNLPLLGKYMIDPDRGVRKRAWEELSAFLLSVTDEVDEIFDAMVKNRTAQARMLGYANYEELSYDRLGRNCYDRDMVEEFRSQVKQYFVPFSRKLNERRRKRIGVEKLAYYDNSIYFTGGNPEPVKGAMAIMQAAQKMFAQLSPETKEFFDFMMENELFDLEARPSKKLGGYMAYIANFKSPFIYGNFNGTYDDVDALTHESGHAFHDYLMRNEEVREAAGYSSELAEIHSMSMEFFAYGWAELFFGERAEDYRAMHLENASTFIPYGCMVDEFQHIVYTKPELTPQERKQVWKELETVYRPDMDYEGDAFFAAGGYWQRQSHIFSYPFYYIDYCLAGVCAMQFKVMMEEDSRKAWQKYLQLCRASGRDFFVNVIRQAGLDSPFEEGCMERLVEKLETATDCIG